MKYPADNCKPNVPDFPNEGLPPSQAGFFQCIQGSEKQFQWLLGRSVIPHHEVCLSNDLANPDFVQGQFQTALSNI
ncbi:hypothetical protein FMEAI12_930001 [Parafrankia sp. Ea1.12]|nr:hypothetical protein FMEAI12_930001 [Parafrankia sp. Ea1.12]